MQQLSRMLHDFIGAIDIGGTKIAVGIGTRNREMIARSSSATDASRSPDNVVSGLLETVEKLAERNGGRLVAIGIACPGPRVLERGRVLEPPNLPKSWRQFDLRSFVQNQKGLPVVVENDANAAAVGEHLFGAGRDFQDLVYLTVSTGIGGGIIAGNSLVHRVGEAGHVTAVPDGAQCGCGARGCLEAECSGTAIARRTREYLQLGRASKLRERVGAAEPVTARMLIEAVRDGDELAAAIWRETIHLMAVGIGGIIALLAPQAVILGGGVAAGAGELLLQPLREELRQRVRIVSMDSVKILQAGLGVDSSLYGALALGARAISV
jgi:glucokinase